MSDGLEPFTPPAMTSSESAVAALEQAEVGSLPVEQTAPEPVESTPQETSGGINPAWNDVLQRVPSVYHGHLVEQFKKWDADANGRITSVQSRFKPYEEFVANQVDPEMLKQSINLLNVFQNDPQSIYKFLHEQYGQDPGQGQNVNDGNEFDLGVPEENPLAPRLSQLEQQQQALIQRMEAAQQADLSRQADIWLADQQTRITQKHAGVDLDWDYILTRTALKNQQGATDNEKALAEAAQEYVNLVNNIRSKPSAGSGAPRVMPATGGVPSNPINVRTLDEQGRKNLAMEMLMALDNEG